MVQKWYEVAKKTLDTGDKIRKSYPGSFNGDSGYLCISNKKLVFVSIKGLFSKKYNVIMNIPFSDISELDSKERNKLLISSNGKRRTINMDTSTEKIVSFINELRQELITT
jgi:hypothetical protein